MSADGTAAVDAPVRLRIFYPIDPLGSIPGGITPFIRGIVGWAPPDIAVSVVGITTDRRERPTGRWLDLRCRGRAFQLFATYAVSDPTRQPRIPAIARYLTHLAAQRHLVRGFDVAEVHRLEPLLLLDRTIPATAVMHQDSEVILQRGSDIRWRFFPGLYFALERRLIPRVSRVFAVYQSAVETLARRYPQYADRFVFTPTWTDPDVFRPVPGEERDRRRDALRRELGLAQDTPVVIFAGRLERQKHPELLLRAFAAMPAPAAAGPAALLLVGDGSLRPALERLAGQLGIAARVHFLGLLPQPALARKLQGADVAALSSRYEGMPLALLEALSTGLPVVSTDVGEVKRVVRDGVNGRLVPEAEPPVARYAAALAEVIAAAPRLRGQACIDAVAPFTPSRVLAPLYDNYRQLARARAAG